MHIKAHLMYKLRISAPKGPYDVHYFILGIVKPHLKGVMDIIYNTVHNIIMKPSLFYPVLMITIYSQNL